MLHTVLTTLPVASAPSVVSVVQPVGSSGYSVSGGKNNSSNLTVQVALRDDFGNPVSGAAVSITLNRNGSSYASGSGTTGSNGTAAFVVRSAPTGTYSTVVTAVTAAGLSWDGATPANSYTKTQ